MRLTLILPLCCSNLTPAVLGKLLKKMEAGKSSENGTYAKAYSPRPYTTESQDNGNAIARSPSGTVANASNRPSSAATGGYRAPDAEVLAKRQHIANIIREAEEESDLPPSMLVSAQFQLDSMVCISLPPLFNLCINPLSAETLTPHKQFATTTAHTPPTPPTQRTPTIKERSL